MRRRSTAKQTSPFSSWIFKGRVSTSLGAGAFELNAEYPDLAIADRNPTRQPASLALSPTTELEKGGATLGRYRRKTAGKTYVCGG